MTSSDSQRAIEPVLGLFDSLEKSSGPAWLLPLRKAGLAAFASKGFPTLNDEDWRYTNLAPLAGMPLHLTAPARVNGAESKALADSLSSRIAGHRLVFVNGRFAAQLSQINSLPAGVRVESLAQTMVHNPALVEKHLGRLATAQSNPFAALNQAFFTDGAFIQIPQGVTLPDPVQLVFIQSHKDPGGMVAPRTLVLAGANSRACIVETYIHTNQQSGLTNPVTEIVAGPGSSVEYIKWQDENHETFHLATLAGDYSASSHVGVHSFSVGARIARNNITAHLGGEGLECVLNGLYLTRGRQVADHHMVVNHASPHCASHEYFNGILDDQSKGVFHGRIHVHPVAQKTDAKQTNKNLLLSNEATADTKPQLEIYADDVKCTHGATIGQLNEESIFYLRTRGIPKSGARRMLIHAFAGEIIERIQCQPVREIIDSHVWDRLEKHHHLAGS